MIYEATVDNLISLVRTIGFAQIDQLNRFFRDVEDKDNVPFYISELVKRRMFDLDSTKSIVKFHNYPNLKTTEAKSLMRAFWVIASFGSNNIRHVAMLPYPSQYYFVSADNEAYDLTICATITDAQLAARSFRFAIPENAVDTINHIAIVNSVQEGEALAQYKFDSYCIFDANMMPQYHQCE